MMYHVAIDTLVPQNNFYRNLMQTLDLQFLYAATAPYYGSEGQQSIDPVVFFKICLVGYLNNLNSDRKLIDFCSCEVRQKDQYNTQQHGGAGVGYFAQFCRYASGQSPYSGCMALVFYSKIVLFRVWQGCATVTYVMCCAFLSVELSSYYIWASVCLLSNSFCSC